ncbi:AsmA family protein [Xanthobacter sp. AM11]|uniref:AsmA family protein n=1 Tax=Xanthobacter sp. AM11 TaxID=3380643 RepID=UPI0039BF266A
MAILPFAVPAEELRRAAVQALAGSTGQRVVIQGEPALRLFPSPRMVLGKVSFPLPAGQSLDADNVVARLNLWHLMAGDVDIADVTVEHPTLVLTGEGATPALAVAPLLASAERPTLRLVDGTIAWRSASGLTQELVSGIDASFERIRTGHGFALSAVFDWRDVRVTSTLAMDDAAAFLSGTPTPTRLLVSTDGATGRLRGRAALIHRASDTAPPLLGFDGEVTGEADSLRDLLAWMGSGAPTPGGFGPFALAATLAVENGDISLTKATLDLDGNRGDGGLLISFAGSRPVVQGTFATDRVNLAPYGGFRLTSDDGRSWSRAPLDLSWLDSFDLDLRLSAAAVTADQTAFSTVAASAVLSGGRLVLALGEARVWGGALRAALTLAPGPAETARPGVSGVRLQLEAEATDVDLHRALEEMAGMRRLEGIGTLQLDVEGAGRSVYDLARNLSGTAGISASDGYLLGLDAAQMLQRIERRPLSAGNDARGGRTGFSQMSSRISIERGMGKVEEMRLESRQVRIEMQGAISIAARDLDLSGRAALVPAAAAKAAGVAATAGVGTAGGGTASGEVVGLPFSVRGGWDTPIILADPLSLIERSGAGQSLIEAVRSRAGGATAQPAN